MTTTSKRTTPKKPKAPAIDDVLAALAAGAYDGDLVSLANAVPARVRAATPTIYWRLTFAGTTWTQQTVTAGERAFVEQLLSVGRSEPFSYMDIDPIRFIGHAIALVVAHLHKIDGLNPSIAVQMAEAVPQEQWGEVIDAYQPD